MRTQKEIWQNEHENKRTLPSMASKEPSSGVVLFVDFLKERNHTFAGKVIDIGCGKGRHSAYMAQLGFDVYAIDYIDSALEVAKDLAKEKGVEDKVQFVASEMDSDWPFEDNFFDLAVDSFASIDIETKEGREKYRDELYRTLKHGGYALITVVSSDDEWEQQLISESPGKEKNSTIWPATGKFQKDYDEDELREFYKDFDIIELKKLSKPAFKLNKEYTATNFWLVLRKS